jgi:hypothetical protein
LISFLIFITATSAYCTWLKNTLNAPKLTAAPKLQHQPPSANAPASPTAPSYPSMPQQPLPHVSSLSFPCGYPSRMRLKSLSQKIQRSHRLRRRRSQIKGRGKERMEIEKSIERETAMIAIGNFV